MRKKRREDEAENGNGQLSDRHKNKRDVAGDSRALPNELDGSSGVDDYHATHKNGRRERKERSNKRAVNKKKPLPPKFGD
jgi:hypothetical protein